MKLTTEALGSHIGIKPASIRARVCRTGSYFGLRPEKLVNGRLLWPADSPDLLAATKRNPSDQEAATS